nr:immunoglobulin light chain junction region [Macaca mulatta]
DYYCMIWHNNANRVF